MIAFVNYGYMWRRKAGACGRDSCEVRTKPWYGQQRSSLYRGMMNLSMESKSAVEYTSLDGNSWLLQFGSKKVVFDPWLVDSLVFFSPWFYQGFKPLLEHFKLEDLGSCDLIVITQSLDDHLHRPTLRQMDKNIPVVATVDSIEILRDQLGFRNVVGLDHGEKVEMLDGEITLHAFQGALTGPPWAKRQNGYKVTVNPANWSLWYEPHADSPPAELEQIRPVDAIVAPVVRTYLVPLNYSLVNGGVHCLETAQKLQARQFIVHKVHRNRHRGFLSKYLAEVGTEEEFRQVISQRKGDMEVIDGPTGVSYPVAFYSSTVKT
uniref:Metallo-beta-lactamase domain-containing protein n=1 Tax=Compsopogon caeruleus TaxID=31354 RepID=A0A6T6B2A6_9RHOD|mmetsp:Transcript_1316/g.2753  ORF Transcript_1316/g.2753 Transcript_1316/m.2753 type:complete len:320 (+) Transcript_1316:77-1036(+)